MATHLDLEEQEQLDALKHFWNKWGNLITWVLIAALAAYAAFNGWQYWQRRQAGLAAVLYDEVDRAAQAGDVSRVERALADMKDRYGGTAYAAHAGLQGAKLLEEKGKPAEAKAALGWVADKAPDEGLRAVARLRLASLLLGEKAYDEALKVLSGSFPAQFTALASDRRGDVLLLQGKREQAVAEFGKAYQGLTADSGDYRRLVGMKLNALGIDPDASGVKTGAAS
ncbi:tetratricopeptide repeat protein [Ottowia sp.]|uniref:YfgM family protein n=1 Tax=Ottowia sp. TaxID=1898956 RepID=UPI002CF4323C|nr:tetratricopeptide repeat protein [Ottowia sp.]HOB67812.1 tetratricopeptide repeat protein [Ottowia sp.]HPZ57201.1 tetratricopeptide repeat protein [Ottowia sp.]HQD46844.1 tetratricopeptide repeat protein [Ottowia sp.]